MRQMTPTTHLFASLAMTAAAVVTAFAIPTPAGAFTITIFGDDDNPKAVTGSGKETNVVRKIGAFSTLRVEGPVDVEAHPASSPSVTVHAEDNIEPLLETFIEGDALVVRVRKGASFRTNRKMMVEVEFTTLAGTQQRGSGDLKITSLNVPRLESSISGSGDLHLQGAQIGNLGVSVAGSGDVEVTGHADEARFSVAGSGDIDAEKLPARRVTVSISGSGDARVNATDAIDATVAGSGDITYLGHPHEVSRRVSGSGSIEPTR